MKKIIFVSLRMADDMKKRVYPVDGNSFIEYSGEVYYAVNAVLAFSKGRVLEKVKKTEVHFL